MDNLLLVQIRNHCTELQHQGYGLIRGQKTVAANLGAEISAHNMLHDNVLAAALTVDKTNNSGMVEKTADPLFVLIMIEENGLIEDITAGDFQNNLLLGKLIPSQEQRGQCPFMNPGVKQKNVYTVTGFRMLK